MYVREYFEESARQSANEMVKDICSVFNEVLDGIDWMDDQTRLRAKTKAAAMTTHIAYPDELLLVQFIIFFGDCGVPTYETKMRNLFGKQPEHMSLSLGSSREERDDIRLWPLGRG